MKLRKISIILAATALAGTGFGQRLMPNEKTIAAPSSLGGTTHRIEKGLQGAATRKAAQTFSGETEVGMGPTAPRQGSPNDEVPGEPGGNGVVEITSARFAAFEDATAAAVGSLARFAKTTSAQMSAAPLAADPRSRFTTHDDGATLDPVTTFEWTRDSWVSNNWLWIGSCQDCTDLLDEEQGGNTSKTVRMPVDGRRIYVTLFSAIGGDWYWIDYQFTAPRGGQPKAASMISPAAGATVAASQTFTWDRGTAQQIYLRIGTCSGCKDIWDEDQGLHDSRTIGIPAEGKVIYVRLFSHFGNDWYYYEYQYRESETRETQTVRVNMTNKLAWEVALSINGKVVGGVPAFETRGIDVKVDTLKVSFEVIQPKLNGRALGDAMSGVYAEISRPTGTYNFVVTNKIGDTYFFAPIITNKTSTTGLLEVNGGLASQNRCNCTVPANTDRVGTGYYKWFGNSNVRIYRSGSNYTGSYRYWDGDTLKRVVQAESGVAELTLTVAP